MPGSTRATTPAPYQQEHKDLIASIRAGKPLNEAQRIAESCLTAIMGRMSAYTGQEITWDQALNSKEDLMPAKLEFGPLPVLPWRCRAKRRSYSRQLSVVSGQSPPHRGEG